MTNHIHKSDLFTEDGAAVASTSSDLKTEKMVSPNTNNVARKAILEERKRQIEEKLSKCNQELKALCIQVNND